MWKKQGLVLVCIIGLVALGTSVAYAEGEQPPGGLKAAGKITSIDPAASSFTMETLHRGELTVVVTKTTQVRSRTGDLRGLQDLEVGMLVAVAGQGNAQGELQAAVVAVGRLGDGISRLRARGEIKDVDVSKRVFILKTTTDGEIEIHVSEWTRFLSRDNSLQGIADLAVGMLAQVQGLRGPEGRLHALRIAAGWPEDRPDIRALGRISAIGDDVFTLETRQGRSIAFQVDGSTQYRSRSGSETTFADLEVGMTAVVAGDQIDANTYRALAVGVGAPQEASARPLPGGTEGPDV